MSQSVVCFWLEKSDLIEVHLRRHVCGEENRSCALSGVGYHNACVNTGERGNVSGYPTVRGDVWSHKDPRWPAQCFCGYCFKDSDYWDFGPTALYRHSQTGELFTQQSAPAGALIEEPWRAKFSHSHRAGPDGKFISVKLPNGHWWCPDGPSVKPDGTLTLPWTRTGTTQKPTARPSIDYTGSPPWHGWLTDGVLTHC